MTVFLDDETKEMEREQLVGYKGNVEQCTQLWLWVF